MANRQNKDNINRQTSGPPFSFLKVISCRHHLLRHLVAWAPFVGALSGSPWESALILLFCILQSLLCRRVAIRVDLSCGREPEPVVQVAPQEISKNIMIKNWKHYFMLSTHTYLTWCAIIRAFAFHSDLT